MSNNEGGGKGVKEKIKWHYCPCCRRKIVIRRASDKTLKLYKFTGIMMKKFDKEAK